MMYNTSRLSPLTTDTVLFNTWNMFMCMPRYSVLVDKCTFNIPTTNASSPLADYTAQPDMVELCLRLTSKKERALVFDNAVVSAAFQKVGGRHFDTDCPPMLKIMNDAAKENQT